MTLEVDHAFIACSSGAREGDALLRLGLVEGSRNTHPGQGTANRRFFFENFMLELLWVANPAEATSAQSSRTRLWQRCSAREPGTSPFGIVFRSAGDQCAPAPFRTWSYHASYLPQGVSIEIAEETTLQEPELLYLPIVRHPGIHAGEPINHAIPIRRIRGIRVGIPRLAGLSEASRTTQESGLLTYYESHEHLLEIHYAGSADVQFDLRPTLPLLFRGVG